MADTDDWKIPHPDVFCSIWFQGITGVWQYRCFAKCCAFAESCNFLCLVTSVFLKEQQYVIKGKAWSEWI